MKRITTTALVVTFSVLLFGPGCSVTGGIMNPEVRVQYRGAVLDDSLVVIVTNAGAKPLFSVSISTSKWDKSYRVSDNLKPGETVEAGWMELPSGLKSGDTVQIYAEGFAAPYVTTLP